MTFRNAENLCPNLQKPPLSSKIPGYAPAPDSTTSTTSGQTYYEWTKEYYEWTNEYYDGQKSTMSDHTSNTIT